jgi:hypothetical protein
VEQGTESLSVVVAAVDQVLTTQLVAVVVIHQHLVQPLLEVAVALVERLMALVAVLVEALGTAQAEVLEQVGKEIAEVRRTLLHHTLPLVAVAQVVMAVALQVPAPAVMVALEALGQTELPMLVAVVEAHPSA